MKNLLSSKISFAEHVINLVIYSIMIFVIVVTLYPILNVIAIALNDSNDTAKSTLYLWPRKFTTFNFYVILSNKDIYNASFISVARTILNTILAVIFSSLIAYAISRQDFILRKPITIILVLTMYFNAGLLPNYFLMKSLGLTNNFLVYIIPNLVNAFNVIILRTYMKTVPEALIESARIDSAGEFNIFTQIVMPLCKPALATIALFVAVNAWNSWFDTYIYNSSNRSLSTLQYELMRMVASATAANASNTNMTTDDYARITPLAIRASITVVAAAPILLVYPFLQKYFTVGLTLGSVK